MSKCPPLHSNCLMLYSKTAHEGKNMSNICFVATCIFKMSIFCILKQLMRNKNMSNSCFVATCTFKMSILLYSKTAHEGNKHVKFMFCNTMYVQNVYSVVF